MTQNDLNRQKNSAVIAQFFEQWPHTLHCYGSIELLNKKRVPNKKDLLLLHT